MSLVCNFTSQQVATIYQKITKDRLLSRYDPSEFCKYLHRNLKFAENKEFEEKSKDFYVTGYLGNGSFGFVLNYANRYDPSRMFAMKFLYDLPPHEFQTALKEVKIQDIMYKEGLALQIIPKLLEGKITMNYQLTGKPQTFKIYAMAMEKMEKTINKGIEDGTFNDGNVSELVYYIVKLFQGMMKVGYIHGDLHIENMALSHKKIKLIDFGWARPAVYRWEHALDFIQLIYSLIGNFRPKGKEVFCDKLAGILLICCNYLFGTQFDNINNFVPGRRGGSIYRGKDFIINGTYPLDQGGITDLNGNLLDAAELRVAWLNLHAPTDANVNFLLDTLKHSGNEFIYSLIKSNSCINLKVRR